MSGVTLFGPDDDEDRELFEDEQEKKSEEEDEDNEEEGKKPPVAPLGNETEVWRQRAQAEKKERKRLEEQIAALQTEIKTAQGTKAEIAALRKELADLKQLTSTPAEKHKEPSSSEEPAAAKA